jgi:hypothetical protein
MKILKQSTASQVLDLGPIVLEDGKTPYTTALTAAQIKVFKHGASGLVDKAQGGSTHLANGVHIATFDATDTNTLGVFSIYVIVAGTLIFKDTYRVVPAAVYDALHAGTGNGLRADVATMQANTVTAAAVASNAIDADALAADASTEIVNAMLAAVAEPQGNLTVKTILQAMAAVLAGRSDQSGNRFYTPNGAAVRVAATTNASGERTAVTLTPGA